MQFKVCKPEYIRTLVKDLPLITSIHTTQRAYCDFLMNIDTLKKKIGLHGDKLTELVANNCYLDTEFGLNEDQSILKIIQNRKEKIGLKICLNYERTELEEPFEKITELENGEQFQVRL